MRILFLDIDGVLVLDRPGVFVPQLLERLKEVVSATKCHLVLSSDWRRKEAGQRLVRQYLKQYGMDFIACTRLTTGEDNERPVEIMDWLAQKASQPTPLIPHLSPLINNPHPSPLYLSTEHTAGGRELCRGG